MSRLEQTARPLILRLTAPNYAFGRTAFNPDQAALLATWALKTAWMRELGEPGIETPTAEQRTYLLQRQLPPSYTNVWAARYIGHNNFASTVGQTQARDSRVPWHQADVRNVLICTLVFHGVILLVRTVDGWGVPDLPVSRDTWQPLWPALAAVPWPPPAAAGDPELHTVTTVVSSWLNVEPAAHFQRQPGRAQEINYG